MFGFLRKIEILNFLTFNIDKNAFYNMRALHFNIIRAILGNRFFSQNNGLKEIVDIFSIDLETNPSKKFILDTIL